MCSKAALLHYLILFSVSTQHFPLGESYRGDGGFTLDAWALVLKFFVASPQQTLGHVIIIAIMHCFEMSSSLGSKLGK